MKFAKETGGKFPEGLLVGTITAVQRENLGLFQKVVVEPSVNFSKLREVFVIIDSPDIRRFGEDEEEE
jgi:rod shape-determining protein MreC